MPDKPGPIETEIVKRNQELLPGFIHIKSDVRLLARHLDELTERMNQLDHNQEVLSDDVSRIIRRG